jgi:hypothetical protein
MIVRVKKAPKPVKKAIRQRKRKPTRSEQIKEARDISFGLMVGRYFAVDLINKISRRAKSEKQTQAVFRDLIYIVLALDSNTDSERGVMWKRYHHHFQSNARRHAFFPQLHRVTRQIASARIYISDNPRATMWARLGEVAVWDSSLLPLEAEPWVVHLDILYPGILEYFLPRFFAQIAKSSARNSTLIRALHIIKAVPMLGWSPEKHTKNLIALKLIEPLDNASEGETVKKFIRDLRARKWPVDR